MTAYKDAATTALYVDDIHRGLAFVESFILVCGPLGNYTNNYNIPGGPLGGCPFAGSFYPGNKITSPFEFGLGVK